MSERFVKVYETILESTLWWGEDGPTRLVWVTLLVSADWEGLYRGTLPGLAGKARVTLDECAKAIERLESPDVHSRSPEFDGRRIERVVGEGWRLLNYEKYREKRTDKQVDDARRQSKKRKRDKSRDVRDVSPDLRSEIRDSRSEIRDVRAPLPPEGVARAYSLQTEEPPKAYLDEALMSAVGEAQARSTWAHYYGEGLPQRGVERLYPWLIKRALEHQLGKPRSGAKGATRGRADAQMDRQLAHIAKLEREAE